VKKQIFADFGPDADFAGFGGFRPSLVGTWTQG
jgi:hypothetical protein